MDLPNHKNLFVGVAAGVGRTALAAIMMGQGEIQSVKSGARAEA